MNIKRNQVLRNLGSKISANSYSVNFLLILISLTLYFFLPTIYLKYLVSNIKEVNLLTKTDFIVQLSLFLLGGYYLAEFLSFRAAKVFLLFSAHAVFLIRMGEILIIEVSGGGYSPLLFMHLEWESVRLAIFEFGYFLFFLPIFILAIHFLLSRQRFFMQERKRYKKYIVVLVILLGSRSLYLFIKNTSAAGEHLPTISFIANAASYYQSEKSYLESIRRITWSPDEKRTLDRLGVNFAPELNSNISPKTDQGTTNLILLYLESFQSNFTEMGGSKFPQLTPNLDRFARKYTYVENFFNAASPTISAMVSSQCGLLTDLSNSTLNRLKGFAFRTNCLSDLLKEYGYRQIYLGGANKSFAGKSYFLNSHQYNEILGWEDWKENPEYRKNKNPWGLHDTDLAREAIQRLESLRKQPPFNLTLLTINTHLPGFIAPDCPIYREGNDLLNSIHCTDHAVGILLDAIEEGGYLKETAILIVGDHMMFPTPGAIEALGKDTVYFDFGKTFFALHAPNQRLPSVIRFASYTPDIAPTVLELLGLPKGTWTFGKSILSEREGYPTLISPYFEIRNNRILTDSVYQKPCPLGNLREVVVRAKSQIFTSCERTKIILGVNYNLFKDAIPLRHRF